MKKRIRQGILVVLTMLLASSVCFAADSEGTKLPDSAANTPAQPAFIEMDDGDYAIPVALEGGSGKASVTTPAALKITDGTAVLTLVWGSENYDYMISGGVRYERVNEEGYSTFEIPVTSFTQPMTVIADTTARRQHSAWYIWHLPLLPCVQRFPSSKKDVSENNTKKQRNTQKNHIFLLQGCIYTVVVLY